MRKLLAFSAIGLDVVPWSVPEVGQGVTKSGRHYRRVGRSKKSRLALGRATLEEWQTYVANAARSALEASPAPVPLPVTGPTRLHIEFIARTPKGRRHGELWAVGVSYDAAKGVYVKKSIRRKPEPDLTNMFKATEDAIEGVIYANDVQTRIASAVALFGPVPGVRVTVHLVEPGDFPGQGEPIP